MHIFYGNIFIELWNVSLTKKTANDMYVLNA